LSMAQTIRVGGLSLDMPLWIAMRAASGVASAWVFVFGSSWCLLRLAELRVSSLGGIIYCGPGIGILVTGILADSAARIGWQAWSGWLLFGLLASVATALIWNVFERTAADLVSVPASSAVESLVGRQDGEIADPQSQSSLKRESRILTFAYGLAGFGYIISATFLPVIARDALPNSNWSGLYWPLFGACVALGAWLAIFIPVGADQRQLLGWCYVMQAAGVVVGIVWPSLPGFAMGSVLLGLPFTAITLFAMREARRLGEAVGVPANRLMGMLTAAYGLGQIVGPPLATRLVSMSGSFSPSLLVAAIALFVGAIVLFLLSRRSFPHSLSADAKT